MIPIDTVLDRLRINAVQRGGRWWADRCPLPAHGTHNASHTWQNWFIRGSGLHHCFSCKGGGNLVELVMILRGVEFDVAREWIKTLDDVPDPVLRVRAEVARLPGSFSMPAGVEKCGAPLDEWNSVPRDYALQRGLTDDQVRRWGIGYALSGRLEGRLFLPVRDARGLLANYAARSFVGHDVRYLSAGSWEGPDKSALFGQHVWPNEHGARTIVVFEGVLNGLSIERALVRAGFDADLGGMCGLDESSGGQIDVRTLTRLATFARVVTATDPDVAGDRVAAGIAHVLRRTCEVVRLTLPDGKDACDVSPEELEQRLVRVFGAA